MNRKWAATGIQLLQSFLSSGSEITVLEWCFKGEHCDPADEIGPRDGCKAHVETEDHRDFAQYADTDIDKTGIQRDAQIADASEIALDAVGDTGQNIEPCHDGQVMDTFLDDGFITCKQCHQETGEQPCDKADGNTVDDFDPHAKEIGFPDSVIQMGAFILCHYRSHGVGNVLLGDGRKVIKAVDGIKGRSGIDTHGIDKGLGAQFADLHG